MTSTNAAAVAGSTNGTTTNAAAASAANSSKKRKTKATTATTKKKDSASENAPIFLRKTYHMIDTCDPAIATWSDDGTTFVVKDPDVFASDIIPQFFKHNNFSSFVRQLNFYGFKKVKSESLKINNNANDKEAKYWRFRHENFRKGRPDLLTDIRKASQTEVPDRQEVDALKNEVSELRARLASMTEDVAKLSSLLHNPGDAGSALNASAIEQQQLHGGTLHSPVEKKRKMFSTTNTGPSILPLQVPSMPTDPLHDNSDLLTDNETPGDRYIPGSLVPLKPNNTRFDTLGSLNSIDHDFSDLFGEHYDPNEDFAFLDEAVPDQPPSAELPAMTALERQPSMEKHPLNPELVKKMHDSLALLPPSMQELFVERLVQTLQHPDSFQHQVDAVTTLAGAAVEEAKKRVTAATGNETSAPTKDDMTVPLAAATLGAFLTQYGSAVERSRRTRSDSTHERPSIVPMEG